MSVPGVFAVGQRSSRMGVVIRFDSPLPSGARQHPGRASHSEVIEKTLLIFGHLMVRHFSDDFSIFDYVVPVGDLGGELKILLD